MRKQFTYPATVTLDEDGRYLVRFPDLPEALTDGGSIEEALTEAADCLTTALGSRLMHDEVIPMASAVEQGMVLVAPRPMLALKLALREALKERNDRVADLARLMEIGHKEARQLLDPVASSRLDRLTEALYGLGQTITVSARPIEEIADAVRAELPDRAK